MNTPLVSRTEVAEFQGFYAPFTVSEKLLQKIWLRGDYDGSAIRTLDGERVEILFPGKWNLLGGPDFRQARLRIDGREVTGDVELHFHAGDWAKHGHDRDPAYDGVVLHVLLFRPSSGERRAVTRAGKVLPAITLLELLHHDLEEYAAEDVLEATLARTHWQATEELLGMPVEARRESLGRHAWTRWEQKVRFARLRVEKLGWTEACHQTAMEILGYRRNRGPMITVATRFPLAKWAEIGPSEDDLMAAAFWVNQGARPANHPRQRLRQYLGWVAAKPDWPDRMKRELAGAVVGARGETDGELEAATFRKNRGLRALRERWAKEIADDRIGGSRFDSMVCDGFLPLAAVLPENGERVGREFFRYWFSWYAGDFPDRVLGTIRTTEVAVERGYANCNGFCQGVLSLSLEKRGDPLVCFEDEGEERKLNH